MRAFNGAKIITTAIAGAGVLLGTAQAAGGATSGPAVMGVPVEFLLFGATLLSVAFFHHRTFTVAVTGLSAIIVYKFIFTGFPQGPGLDGFLAHMWHERIILSNLLLLLLGFAVLSRHFEDTSAPEVMPRFLPDNWLGPARSLAWSGSFRAFSTTLPRRSSAASSRSTFLRRCISAISPRSSPRRTPAARARSSATRRRR